MLEREGRTQVLPLFCLLVTQPAILPKRRKFELPIRLDRYRHRSAAVGSIQPPSPNDALECPLLLGERAVIGADDRTRRGRIYELLSRDFRAPVMRRDQHIRSQFLRVS